jgi:peptidoglycan/LPS O-acetylase OafA/YrhL
LFTNSLIIGQDVLRLFSYDGLTHHFALLPPQLVDLGAVNSGNTLLGSAFSITAQSWSIAVEILFYFVAPWLLLRSTFAIIAIISASIVFRFILAYHGYVHNFFLNGIIFCEIAIFLSGSLACRFYRAWLASGKRERFLGSFISQQYLRILIPTAGVAITGVLMDYYFEGWRLFPAGGKWGEGLFEVPYAYWAVIAATICASPWIFHMVGRYKWDRWIGDLSYPIYISHMFIIEMVSKMHLPDDHVSTYVLGFTLLTSVVLMYAVERPVDALRHRWFKRVDTKSTMTRFSPL